MREREPGDEEEALSEGVRERRGEAILGLLVGAAFLGRLGLREAVPVEREVELPGRVDVGAERVERGIRAPADGAGARARRHEKKAAGEEKTRRENADTNHRRDSFPVSAERRPREPPNPGGGGTPPNPGVQERRRRGMCSGGRAAGPRGTDGESVTRRAPPSGA